MLENNDIIESHGENLMQSCLYTALTIIAKLK